MLKKIFRGTASTLVFVTLLLTMVTATLAVTVRPAHIKSWIAKSDVYKLLPDTLLDQAKGQGENDLGVPLDDANVRTAAKDAFSPQFIQTSSETFIDSTFRWLDGSTAKPDFSIDLQASKEKFAANVADYAKERYAGLPACATGSAPTSTDPLTVDCRPAAGINIEQEIAQLQTQIVSSKDLLSQPKLTVDTLEKDNPKDSIFTKTAPPKAYQFARQIPLILGVLALLNMVVLLFTSITKRAGFKRIATLMISTGLLAGFIMWAGSLAVGALNSSASNAKGEWSAITKNLVASSVYAMQRDVMKTGLIIAGSAILLGILLITTLKVSNKEGKPKKTESNPLTDPKPKEEPVAPKPAPKAAKPTAPVQPKTAPLIKPKQQPKPTIIKPTGPVGSSNKLIQ